MLQLQYETNNAAILNNLSKILDKLRKRDIHLVKVVKHEVLRMSMRIRDSHYSAKKVDNNCEKYTRAGNVQIFQLLHATNCCLFSVGL